MRKSFIYFCTFLILVSLWTACKKDPVEEPTATSEYPGVDRALWLYFERFEAEGRRRGFDIDLIERGITATIAPIEQEHVGGVCNYFSNHKNQLVIDDYIWANTSEFQKELILFHELGHCYLLRDHREDAYDDGVCKSIMRSGTSGCTDQYHGATRQQYLNELFDPDSVN